MQALRTAATGMAAQQMNVEVISNNIANMNTVGFKKQSAVFEDMLYQNIETPGAQSSDTGTVVPTGVQLGSGVKTGSVYRITTQGDLQSIKSDSGQWDYAMLNEVLEHVPDERQALPLATEELATRLVSQLSEGW